MKRQTKTAEFMVKLFEEFKEKKTRVDLQQDKKNIYSLFYNFSGQITLQHFEEVKFIYSEKEKEVVSYIGYCVSDKNVLNTLLDLLEHDQKYMFRLNHFNEMYLDGPEHEIDKNFNDIDFINKVDSFELEEKELIEGFQELINTGVIYKMQDKYIKAANELINKGVCTR